VGYNFSGDVMNKSADDTPVTPLFLGGLASAIGATLPILSKGKVKKPIKRLPKQIIPKTMLAHPLMNVKKWMGK